MNTARRECILLIDDDRDVTDALSLLLERDGRTTIVCADLESAEIALMRHPVTHIVTDVQFSGAFGFEGLHSLARMRSLRPECRIILMTGFATDALRATAISDGAAAVLAKPFEVEELEHALGPFRGDDAPYKLLRIPPIEEVLHGNILDCAFQPIVHLGAGNRVFAFEALTRTSGDAWSLGGPAELFEYAARRARLTDLNLAALQRAVAQSKHLPAESIVFINVDPTAFADGQIAPVLRSAATRAGLSLDRVVLEITERSAFADCNSVAGTFSALRDLGIRFALDDHGSAYSHLSIISQIRPSFIKISQSFGTAFETDETKCRIVRHVGALARDFGALTILEGIESSATAIAAASAGIDFGQGFHFGRPSAAATWTAAGVLCAA